MKNPKAIKLLFISFIIACLVFFLKPLLYCFHPDKNLYADQLQLLVEQASQSLSSNDVPVGSLIIYNDTILSAGYNTVYLDSNPGGHAEINAIENAVKKIGYKNFSKLDRNHLELVSTFEPCMMCKGAIIEYNIKKVTFLKGKGLLHWLNNDLRQFRYEWNKSQASGSELQDSLFRKHPGYR